MNSITVQQRKKLKAAAHHLKPVVYIGKNGMSEGLVASLDKSLSDHELIKVKFISFKEEKRDLLDTLIKDTGSELVSIIGNIAVLFRRNQDPDKQRINF